VSRSSFPHRRAFGTLATLAFGITLLGSGPAHADEPVVINTNPNVTYLTNALGATNFTGGSASCVQTNQDFGVLRAGFTIVPGVPAGGRIEVVITDKLSYQTLRTDTILAGDSKAVAYTQAGTGLNQFDPVRFDVFSYSSTGVKRNLGVASTTAYCGWADQSKVLSDIMTVLGESTNGTVHTFTRGDTTPAPALQNLTGFVDRGRLKITYGQYDARGLLVDKGVLAEYAVAVQPGHQTWFKSPVSLPTNAVGKLTVEYVSDGYAAEPFTTSFDTRVKTSSDDDD
jgi:hypothetical protein